jgi:Tfp pilus assembly protein PilF
MKSMSCAMTNLSSETLGQSHSKDESIFRHLWLVTPPPKPIFSVSEGGPPLKVQPGIADWVEGRYAKSPASMTSTEQKEQRSPYVPNGSEALIRSELAEVVRSRSFVQGNRLSRFLTFIVEDCLNGTTERLKESVIGVEVYDRAIGYDPKIDSIVRSEARRLRRKLKEYYETEGRHSQVIITIPTGGYIPSFEFRSQTTRELAVANSGTEQDSTAQVMPGFPKLMSVGLLLGVLICAISVWTSVRVYRNRQRMEIRPPQMASENAYRLYLEGRFYWNKRTPDFIHKAIARFEEALRVQPNYALAYSGLADSYALTASGLPPIERSVQAKSAAEHALVLDPMSAEAHTSEAFVLYKFGWDWQASEDHFRRALQLNPNYPLVHHWFGESLILRGRTEEGLAELRRAEAIEPLSLPIKNELARGLYRSRQYDQAIVQAKHVIDLDPNFSNAYATLTYAFEQKHDYRQAVEADLQVMRIAKRPEAKLRRLQKVFERYGWRAYWHDELAMLEEESPEKSVSNYVIAELCVRSGDYERALKLLEKSFDERNDAPLVIGIEPLMDPLRSDVRFKYLLRRSGLDFN